MAKKAEAGLNFGYKGTIEAEYKTNYVDPDFVGFLIVNAGTRMEFDYLTSMEQWYISVVVLLDAEKVHIVANKARLPALRMILGFTKKGKFEFTKVAEGKEWRV